jgi:hypothetical protein
MLLSHVPDAFHDILWRKCIRSCVVVSATFFSYLALGGRNSKVSVYNFPAEHSATPTDPLAVRLIAFPLPSTFI